MTPLARALHRAKRDVTVYRLPGVNHMFQPSQADWPLVNGVQQATFSPDALKKIHTWVATETKSAGAPSSVTVKRLTIPRKATKVASVPRLRG
jgi:hypothetical protein